MYNGPFFGTFDSYKPEDLIAGPPIMSGKIILAKGQNLKRGAVLGRIKSSNVFVFSRARNEAGEEIKDGSEIPMRILACDVDASEADRPAMAYRAGTYLKGGIILDKSHDIEVIKYDLEIRSIYLAE